MAGICCTGRLENEKQAMERKQGVMVPRGRVGPMYRWHACMHLCCGWVLNCSYDGQKWTGDGLLTRQVNCGRKEPLVGRNSTRMMHYACNGLVLVGGLYALKWEPRAAAWATNLLSRFSVLCALFVIQFFVVNVQSLMLQIKGTTSTCYVSTVHMRLMILLPVLYEYVVVNNDIISYFLHPKL